MKTRSPVLTSLALVFLSAIALGKPCGSDGPIPFLNMTGSITLPVKSISSVGPIQEFTFWEKHDALVYRNQANELRISYFGSGSDIALSRLTSPLSRLVDEANRYLVTDGSAYFLDAKAGGSWTHFAKGDPEKLFWHKDDLYLLKWVTPILGANHFEVGRYTAGEKSAKAVCNYTPPNNVKLKLAAGHRYPDAFLYQEIPLPGGTKSLAFYRLNATTCDIQNIGLPTEPIEGTVLEVHRFEKMDAFAVRIDHPTKNFRWATSSRCDYLELSSAEAMIPNHDRPLLVTWDKGVGLTLYNVETLKKAEAFRSIGIGDVIARDLWIPNRESDLLMSPKLELTQTRRMMQVDVEELLPVAGP